VGVVEHRAEAQASSLKDLRAYWLAKKGARIAPPRSAIDPAEIVKLLPHVALVDVVGDPPRFRFRLFGTALVAAYGEDLTGKFGDELDLDVRPEIHRLLSKVVRECCEDVALIHFTRREAPRYVEYERILLPVSNDGSTVDMILIGYAIAKAYTVR
jgi:hypothetical protein